MSLPIVLWQIHPFNAFPQNPLVLVNAGFPFSEGIHLEESFYLTQFQLNILKTKSLFNNILALIKNPYFEPSIKNHACS